MRKAIICVGLAALLMPAAALAGEKTYKGDLGNNGKMKLTVNVSGGQPVSIAGFTFKKSPADCEDTGEHTVSGFITYTPPLPEVAGNAFDIDLAGGGQSVSQDGQFKQAGKVVKGKVTTTLDTVFEEPPHTESCTTPLQNYSLKRVKGNGKRPARVADAGFAAFSRG